MANLPRSPGLSKQGSGCKLRCKNSHSKSSALSHLFCTQLSKVKVSGPVSTLKKKKHQSSTGNHWRIATGKWSAVFSALFISNASVVPTVTSLPNTAYICINILHIMC